jgi:Tfp pilus tip-associated adhesin PilY1
MNKQQLIKKFLDAVATWKIYVVGLQSANKKNDQKAKSVLGRAVFYWIKQAEHLKKQIDKLLGLTSKVKAVNL